MTEYDKQAKEFLKATNTQIAMQEIRSELAQRPIWATEDKIQHGAEYRVALIRGSYPNDYKDYRFSFWNSIQASLEGKAPSKYDILAAISGSIYCPDTFEDFVAEYGYEIDSVKGYKLAQATYKGVKSESKALHELFSEEELNQLAEIN